ncbi:MAG: bifunctional diaminohydroxyphosphoribosylaminopyrimidine deaminase/5-amino-6-(5-phosphoribosylamino)uracil reductase RibD [Oligoflexia bacterium]|nr:bifunctional diaminohydroxyphosphoribosylaminopyrimidine deaminase/5-amino-6-(5-phosphoribosylamino)uracil reductase RibD [Oligoflexia bacterium]
MGEVLPHQFHEHFMKKALELAKKAKGNTHPNPPVGALVVDKNGNITGQGFHPKAGEDHAEVIAINEALKAQKDLSDCTLYITLEPCNHQGKTPPCVDKILESKIKKVVVGCVDPNPLMSGKSIEILKNNQIDVTLSSLNLECEKLIRGFKSIIKNKRPFVTIKCAVTLDGKISTDTGESKWITSHEARVYAHKLRFEHDAVLVGIGTLLRDDPLLDARLYDENKQLVKAVLDPWLETPVDAKLLTNAKEVIIFCDSINPDEKKEKLQNCGFKVVPVDRVTTDELDLNQILQSLLNFKVQEVFVEGGSKVLGSFLKYNLFDQINYFMAPKILGQNARNVFEGFTASSLKNAFEFQAMTVKKVGSDFVFEGQNVHRPS